MYKKTQTFGTYLGPAVRKSSTDGFAPIHLGIRSYGNEFGPLAVFVRRDDAAVQVNLGGGSSFWVHQLDEFQARRILHHSRRRSRLVDGARRGAYATSGSPLGAGRDLLGILGREQGNSATAAGGKGGGTGDGKGGDRGGNNGEEGESELHVDVT